MATDSQQLDAAVSAPSGGLASLAFACTVVVVADLDRSSQWYQSVLGFTEHTRVRIDGANVVTSGGSGDPAGTHPGRWADRIDRAQLVRRSPTSSAAEGNKFLAFAVEDLQRATDQLQDRGVPIIWRDKELAPGIRSTAIRDVEDNFIHIVQH
jgi:catechol 2,3-dioxygenase-like lactoylglutathione lyase family enzyme